MTAGVIIKIDSELENTGWSQILRAFNVTEVYELPGLGVPLQTSIGLETVDDVTHYHNAKIIVVQPETADFVQGETFLAELEHPDEAIYVFGGTQTRLTQHDLEDVDVAHYVYIPSPNKVDLFPSQAGAIVLWDRFWKRHYIGTTG